MKNKEEDLRTVPEEGAPISLKKVVDKIKTTHELTVLVNNNGIGIVNDAGFANCTAEERQKQAEYFLGLNLPLPPYLKKYLEYMFPGEDVEAKYKFASTNKELMQLIGLIQLVGGSLNAAKKQKTGIRIYIEEPETHLHPKRERYVVGLLEKLKEDYGYKPDQTKNRTNE